MVSAPNKSSGRRLPAGLHGRRLSRWSSGRSSGIWTSPRPGKDRAQLLRNQAPGRRRLARQDQAPQRADRLALHRARSPRRGAGATPTAYAADLQTSIWLHVPRLPWPRSGEPALLPSQRGREVHRGRQDPGPLGVSNLLGYGDGSRLGIFGRPQSHRLERRTSAIWADYSVPASTNTWARGTKLPNRIDVNDAGEPISKCGPLAFAGSAAFGDASRKTGARPVFTATGGAFCSAPTARPRTKSG